MSNPAQSLFAAILNDDRARAKELLKKNPHLSRHAVETDGRYASGIAHWIYVGDTALHVAAAGYRVEIAKMLLAAGAAMATEVARIANARIAKSATRLAWSVNQVWVAKRDGMLSASS